MRFSHAKLYVLCTAALVLVGLALPAGAIPLEDAGQATGQQDDPDDCVTVDPNEPIPTVVISPSACRELIPP